MDQSQAPLLQALADYRRSNRYGFSPPGHRQGAGVDDSVLAVMGKDPFRNDVLATGGLDDRLTRGKFLPPRRRVDGRRRRCGRGVFLHLW